MNNIITIFMVVTFLASLIQNKNTYSNFTDGIKQGLQTFIKILPAILSMLLLTQFFNGIIKNIKSEDLFILNVLPLIIIRPFSGAAAIGCLINIINIYGINSIEALYSSIIMGGSETTFYAINTYYSVSKIKPSKKIYVAAILADLTLYIVAYFLIM